MAKVPHLAAPEREREVKADVRARLGELHQLLRQLPLTSTHDHEQLDSAFRSLQRAVEQAEVAGTAAWIEYGGGTPTPMPSPEAHGEALNRWMRSH